jgi:hypothetical protein
MIPRWHVLFGAVFTFILWLAVPNIDYLYLGLVFFSSFLIDFDHYLCAVIKTKSLSLKNAFEYHKEKHKQHQREKTKGIKKKGDFHLLHTVEFHALIGLLSIFWAGFFYIFLGMMLHSITDAITMFYDNGLHRREFFFFNWLRRKVVR